MKIAVPVDNDKKTIFKRTGQAPFFAIFNDTEIESIIPNAHGKEGHNHHDHDHEHEHAEDDKEHLNQHKKDISGIKGCDIILVQAVGEHMQEALDSFGIKIQKIRKKDGLFAHEAVANFLQNKI
ncbi:MAG: NifB/NifX family molybdenum-iron cluster-binding protein [Sulfurimonas sp.]|jgi:predicted Fe-Mo cluster-binding NifX family protein|nr:NifB/NifX family molybdenum-iron cluster-binding protein [Sulfurimonas sp.]